MNTEVEKEMMAPDGVQEQLVDRYSKYFTHEEVVALLAFYSTPVGQKSLTVTPLMLRESMAIGQRWAQANSPRLTQILQDRLRAEGLIM